MTAHDHAQYDPMCWRCDLARDELDDDSSAGREATPTQARCGCACGCKTTLINHKIGVCRSCFVAYRPECIGASSATPPAREAT